MARRIKPFDDSLQKDRRRATKDQSTDTSAIDAYRQGVELTSPIHFANGIAKIHDGYNDQSGEHGVPQLVYGQERPILRDSNSFLDTAKFDPVARFDDPPRDQILFSWSPRKASVPLIAWYRADLGVSQSSGIVSDWADQSGFGDANRNLTQPGVNKPTLVAASAAYGNQTILDFASAWLERPGAWSVNYGGVGSPLTVVFVGDTSASQSSFISSDVASNLLWAYIGGAIVQWYPGGPSGSVADPSLPAAYVFTDDGGALSDSAKLYRNNFATPIATSVQATTSCTGFDVGKASSGIANLTGRCAEVMFFSGVLTAADLKNLSTYFNVLRKYGIPCTA
jgi:hypothetical protein